MALLLFTARIFTRCPVNRYSVIRHVITLYRRSQGEIYFRSQEFKLVLCCQILLQPYDYILKCSGKKIRSKLIQAFNFWLEVPENHIKVVSEIVEMLHNASLM